MNYFASVTWLLFGCWVADLCAQAAPVPSAPVPNAPVPQVGPSVDLGVIAVGAIVEASFAVRWHDASAASAAVDVVPPDGVTVLSVQSRQDGTRATTVVAFAIDTRQARGIDAAFVVRAGKATASVALQARILALPPGGSRVLVAQTPFEASSSDDPKIFDGWRQIVAAASLDVDYRLVREGQPTFTVAALERVDVVLAGEDALVALDDQQVAKLQGFVCGGGRVIVCANAFFVGTVRGANRIAEAFDLAIVDKELPLAGELRVEASGLARHALTVGVEAIEVIRPSPVAIGDGPRRVALATLVAPSEQPFVALATTASGGEMVVVGDSLWWSTANRSPGFARLLRNLLVRAPRLR